MARNSLGSALKNIASRLRTEFTEAVLNDYLRAVEQEAERNAPTTAIKGAISIIPAKQTAEGVYEGGIQVDLSIAPEGRAYELGSGLHGEKNAKYPIPKEGTTPMMFEWDKADPSKHIIIDGKVLLFKVEHPGVEARPYIRPAFESKDRLLRGLLLNLIETEFKTEFAK